MRLTGTLYRAHNPRWSWTPLSGEGARRHGGRFNPVGQPALYTSLSAKTAMLEASPLGRPFQPLTLVAYAVDAAPMLEATDPAALARLGATGSDLSDPHWEALMRAGQTPVQHRIAEAAIAAGYVGVLVQSFARGAGPEDLNAVFWTWDGALRVIDDDGRLPRDGASWQETPGG